MNTQTHPNFRRDVVYRTSTHRDVPPSLRDKAVVVLREQGDGVVVQPLLSRSQFLLAPTFLREF